MTITNQTGDVWYVATLVGLQVGDFCVCEAQKISWQLLVMSLHLPSWRFAIIKNFKCQKLPDENVLCCSMCTQKNSIKTSPTKSGCIQLVNHYKNYVFSIFLFWSFNCFLFFSIFLFICSTKLHQHMHPYIAFSHCYKT